MPELPEVETIRSQLTKHLPLRITSWETSPVVNSILHDREFNPKGKTIERIERKGKLMRFVLGNAYILSHLGMSGSWLISDKKVKEKHTHLQLSCKDESGNKKFLAYVDPRRFGHMYWAKTELSNKKWNELGVDLTTKEFTVKYLTDSLQKYPNRFLKVTLLDQKLFAGVGNYIANEICARAKIMPDRICSDIKKNEFNKIYKACSTVLDQAINTGGVTFSGGYQDAEGNKGKGVQNLVVFHQEICKMCDKAIVKKIMLAKRGTFYCPKCQK